MSKGKRKRDTNELAAQVVGLATGDVEEASPADPRAVKRGEARAAKLTPAQRSKIAKGAAAARWGKKK